MHCELAPNITYTEYISVIQKQKAIIEELINERKNPITYPGLEVFKSGYKSIPINTIPGVDHLGVSLSSQSRKTSGKELFTELKQILTAVKDHDCALPFLKPVDKNDVPDYYDVIKFPMGKFLVKVAIRPSILYKIN